MREYELMVILDPELDDRTVATQRYDVEDVLPNINPIDSRGTRHIAFRHSNLLWFDRLMMRQEDEADHPINGDARCEAGCGGSRLCAAWSEPASGVRGSIGRSVEHAIPQCAA